MIEMRCPKCDSDHVTMPLNLGVAPEGHAWDGTLVLLTCGACGCMAPMPKFTLVDGERPA